MNIDIREYIRNNFSNSTIEELKDSITSSIESKDEMVLPGLGVLFEILWNNSNNQNEILEILKNNM